MLLLLLVDRAQFNWD